MKRLVKSFSVRGGENRVNGPMIGQGLIDQSMLLVDEIFLGFPFHDVRHVDEGARAESARAFWDRCFHLQDAEESHSHRRARILNAS